MDLNDLHIHYKELLTQLDNSCNFHKLTFLEDKDYSHFESQIDKFKISYSSTIDLKIEFAEKIKNTFMASISHEIRTPLNGIIGMAKLISQTKLTTEQEEYNETLTKCSFQLLEIINDILDYSKMANGHISLLLEPFEIRKCIEDSCDVVSVKAIEKNINLITQIMKNKIYAANFHLSVLKIQLIYNFKII